MALPLAEMAATPSTVASTPPMPHSGWPMSSWKGGKAGENERPGTVPSGASRPVRGVLPRRPNSTQPRLRGAGGKIDNPESVAARLEADLAAGTVKTLRISMPNSSRRGKEGSPQTPRSREAWGPGGQANSPKRTNAMAGGPNSAANQQLQQGSVTAPGQAPVDLPSVNPSTPAKVGSHLVKLAFRAKPEERGTRCTMLSVWTACDTFWEFDRDHSGVISRQEYIALLGESPTVNRLRMLRRARLEHRFRTSAKPVTLEEFLGLIWPEATIEDRKLMERWSQLRESYDILAGKNFRGTELEMKKVYDLLRTKEPGKEKEIVLASEILRALVLPAEQMQTIVKGKPFKQCSFDFEEFKQAVWPHLRHRWIAKDTILKMKREEEQAMSNSFEVAFRGGLTQGQSK